MSATLVIAYPKGSNIKMDYYVNKHMPKAFGQLKAIGAWHVIKVTPGTDSPYEIMAFIEFSSMEQMAALAEPEWQKTKKAAAEDLPNYSQLPATSWVAEKVGSGQ
ncbi:hypothetical protein F5B20DRAFT_583306 [Whalleya microplaca]|nr:hypothetical protein F5B20DRAFT_583306 [Whalleya microplaca]